MAGKDPNNKDLDGSDKVRFFRVFIEPWEQEEHAQYLEKVSMIDPEGSKVSSGPGKSSPDKSTLVVHASQVEQLRKAGYAIEKYDPKKQEKLTPQQEKSSLLPQAEKEMRFLLGSGITAGDPAGMQAQQVGVSSRFGAGKDKTIV